MTAQEWGIIGGGLTAMLLGLAPWMFMVHGKLAVLADRLGRVQTAVDKLVDREDTRQCASHSAKLEDHERRLVRMEADN